MNKLKISGLFLFLFMTVGVFAQKTDDYLFKIDKKTVSVEDFEYAYLKDRKNNIQPPVTIPDFLKSFSLLKVKVAEAEASGLDKDPVFVSEYNKYAESTKNKYINDTASAETAAKLVYDRLQYNVEVSKIYIPFTSDKLFPKDTLAAYNKIKEIRASIINAPDSEYRKIARLYPAPESPAEKDIVWTTALTSPKILEDAIYNTPIGSISEPIRTNTGYYLVKTYRKRPDRGEVRIAHILFLYPENATQAEKDSVRSLSQRVITDLDDNQPFEGICQAISADRATAPKGGDLGWFSTRSNLIPEFDSIFYSLKKLKDYTRPIEFDYGFHIFKLIGKVHLDPWPEIKPDLISEMEKHNRNGDIESLKLKRLSQKYPYAINSKVLRSILDIADTHHASDSLFFKNSPDLYNKKLVTIRNTEYNVSDFVDYIFNNLSAKSTLSTDIVYEKLDGFVLNKLTEVNEKRIIDDTPELKHLLQEYYDGILLFTVMDKEIWTKASIDTEGLTKTFDRNRNKYTWTEPKYKGYVIYLKDRAAFDKALAIQNEYGSQDNFIQILTKSFSNDSIKPLYIEKGIWAKGENDFVDNTLYKTEIKKEVVGYPFFFIHGKMLDQPQTFEDVKGLVIQDYQDALEKQWTEYIIKKHKVVVNNEALKRLTQKYQQ